MINYLCRHLYSYVCTCVCMCVYVCMHLWMYVYMHVCMYVCMHVRMCVYACVYVCIYACINVCMHVRVCMYVCMHVCAYAFLYVCMYGSKGMMKIAFYYPFFGSPFECLQSRLPIHERYNTLIASTSLKKLYISARERECCLARTTTLDVILGKKKAFAFVTHPL